MSEGEQMSVVIHEFTAHPIDLAKAKVTQESIPKDAELDSYITGLLAWAYKEEDVRQFEFAEKTTEVRGALEEVIQGKPLASVADVIASRLLKQEKLANKEVAHLKGVHEGMLLQAIFSREGARGMLLAKVDLSEFLGRQGFRSQKGIDKKHRLLKFCLVEFSSKNEIQAVHVGDTNSSIAAYWWKDFLELTEVRNDVSNTKLAFAAFDVFLAGALKKDYPRDYPCLFNEVLRRFKRPHTFKFSKFLDEIFDHYQPCHTELNVADLKARASQMPAKKKFDANFTVVPTQVEKRFKKTYTLTPQIELTVAGDLEDLPGQISALALNDGTKGVFVKSEQGFNQFPARPVLQGEKIKDNATSKKAKAASDPNVNVQQN